MFITLITRFGRVQTILVFGITSVSVVLLTRGTFCIVLLPYVICVFCLLVVLVQVIDWKDLSPK